MIWFNILNIFAQKWHTIIALIYTVKQNEHILSCQWSTLNWNWIEVEGHCSVWISGVKWPELIITSKWAHVLISCFTGSHIRGTFFHTPPPAHPPRISLSLSLHLSRKSSSHSFFSSCWMARLLTVWTAASLWKSSWVHVLFMSDIYSKRFAACRQLTTSEI